MEFCLTGGVDHCGADVFEVGWTGAVDAVECGADVFEVGWTGAVMSLK